MDMPSLHSYNPMAGVLDFKSEGAENASRLLSRGGHGKSDPAEVQKAAKEFEGYFIASLLKEMRKTVHPGLIKNKEGQQFSSFYDQEIGRLAAQNEGLGLSRMLQESLTAGLPTLDRNPKPATQVLSPFSR